MREQPEFDLRIIRGEQHVAGLGGEGGANLAAQFRADRNVLQIRICRRQSSRRGAGLVEGGVQAAGRGTEQRRQRVDIGGLEFGKLAVLQHQARDFVVFGEAFEDIDRRRDRLAFAVLHRLGQVELVEENVAELLGRIDVEFDAGEPVNFFGLGVNLALQAGRHFGESAGIDLHAGLFHAGEHWDEGKVDVFVELRQPGLLDFVAQRGGQTAGDVGSFGKSTRQASD